MYKIYRGGGLKILYKVGLSPVSCTYKNIYPTSHKININVLLFRYRCHEDIYIIII